MPPDFLRRNGFQVVAYRKYGDAGLRFNGHAGGWDKFNARPPAAACEPRQFPFSRFGLAQPKSRLFGQFELLPQEVCRGGTDAKQYFYDAEFKPREDEQAKAVLNGVNTNRASWWELQLYSLVARDLRTCPVDIDWNTFWNNNEPLNFDSERARVGMIIRTELAQLAAEAEHQADISIKLVMKKLTEQCEQALKHQEEEEKEAKSSFLKAEAVDCMNLGLRSCALLSGMKKHPLMEAAAKVRNDITKKLMSRYKQVDEKQQECLTRVIKAIERGNVLSDLQEEVNVVLNTLNSCS